MLHEGENWEQQLPAEIHDHHEALRREWERIHSRWRETRATSRKATAIEKFLIRAVASLYIAERVVRRWLRLPEPMEYLAARRRITDAVFGIIRREFEEIAVESDLPASEADGTGGLTLAMLVSFQDREEVEALLPDGLHLAPEQELLAAGMPVPPGKHPVKISLGLNTNARPVWMKASFPGMDYLEMVIGIPWTRLAKEFGEPSGPFFYVPALFLNRLTPTVLGWAFGFRKQLRRIVSGPASFEIRGLLSNKQQLRGDIQSEDAVHLVVDIPELTPWRECLEQPIISRSWLRGFRCTHFHWEWGAALASRAHVSLENRAKLIPADSGKPLLFNSRSGDGQAFVISVPWRLLVPFKRTELRRGSLLNRLRSRFGKMSSGAERALPDA